MTAEKIKVYVIKNQWYYQWNIIPACQLIARHPTPEYRKTSNISRILVDNKIVDNSDVVGASPVGAAPATSSFST